MKKLRDAAVMLTTGRALLKVLVVSEATLHRWRNQYGGMKSEGARRLKLLEGDNTRIQRPLVDAELD